MTRIIVSQVHELPYKFTEQFSDCTEWLNIVVAKLNPRKYYDHFKLTENTQYTKTKQKMVINTVEKTKDLAPGSLNCILFSVRTTASTLVEWLPFENTKKTPLIE